MVPSHMEHKQQPISDQDYTHKEYNCNYSHKKLRLRLRQREQDNEEMLAQTQLQHVKTSKPTKDLFRPYALDENNTPRKRKISKLKQSFQENYNISNNTPEDLSAAHNLQYYQQQQQDELDISTFISSPTTTLPHYQSLECTAGMSPSSYNTHLQTQRAALYMRYMAQMHQQNAAAATLLAGIVYPRGYPNVTSPIFNGC